MEWTDYSRSFPKLKGQRCILYSILHDYTQNPSIAYYDTTVKDIDEKDGLIDITFNITPSMGPHDYIGEDEIKFRISQTGEIVQEDFRHLKSYHLPENLKSMEKGLLPTEEG